MGGRRGLPNFRLLLNELLHQVPAPNRVEDDDLDSALFQVRLAAEEALVFADDDARDAEEDACASTFLFPSYNQLVFAKEIQSMIPYYGFILYPQRQWLRRRRVGKGDVGRQMRSETKNSHISHGDSVVYIVLPLYIERERRPAF